MKPIPPLLLAALVAWPSLGYSAPSPQPGAAALEWQQSQRTDAADGSTYTRFTLAGRALASPQVAGSERPDLVVDCGSAAESSSRKGRLLAASLRPGVALKVLYIEPEEIHGTSYYPKVSVLYRTDEAKEEKEQWSMGSDKNSVSVPGDTLKKILRAHTAAISASDAHGTQITLQFDLADASKVEQACGW
jgi:hypothetical protein